MNLFKKTLLVAALSLGMTQAASATTVTYVNNGGTAGVYHLITPNALRPTWYNLLSAAAGAVTLTYNDVTQTANLSGIVNFNTYTFTSNPANNAANWQNASQGNYSLNVGATGLSGSNSAGVGQYIAAFYGQGTSASHTVDLALHGLQNQNFCSVPNNCSVTNLGNGQYDQYIGAWALANPSVSNLAFGLQNLGGGNFGLVAWFQTMAPYAGAARVYQIDFGANGSPWLFHIAGGGGPGPSVPEPATMGLLAGSLALGAYRKRKNSAA